jgi:hypothetical protein
MIDIIGKLDAYTETQITVFPCHTNRASSIGAACERMLVYYRTAWEQQRKPSVGLQRIFNLGNEIEKIETIRLMQAGVRISRTQEPLNIPEHQLTGHPDGFVMDDETGEQFPYDIKSMSPFVFVKINEPEDFVKFSWTKKYIAQLMIYMHASQKAKGVFIMVNKSSGEERVVWIDYDPALIAEIFEKADRINAHVKAKTLPDRIGYCDECSEYCPFQMLCLPDVEFKSPEFVVDAELTAMITRWQVLKPAAKECEALEAEIKDERIKPRLAPGTVGEKKTMFIGPVEVNFAWTVKKPYEVKGTAYWTIKMDAGGGK